LDILLETLQDFHIPLYAVVFVFAIIKLPLYKDTSLIVLPIILFITLCTELVGMYITDVYRSPNAIIYNIYYFFYFSLFFYVFMKEIEEEKFKKFIKIGILIYWLVYLSDWIFTDFITKGFVTSYIIAAGILIFCILLYYISILQSSLVLVVKNDLLFWFSVGLFLFYIGYLPIKIIRTWFYKQDSFFELLLLIQFLLIIIMYLFFLTGFLWMKKKS
jgi:hypothetical protein